MLRPGLHNRHYWPSLVLLLIAAGLATACAPEPTPGPTPAATLPPAKAAFWDCVLTWQRRYQDANAFQRALSLQSEMFQSQSAANKCQKRLPDYAGPITDPNIAGAQNRECLDAEKDAYQAAYPRGPDPGSNDFILQALTRICYVAESRPDYGFAAPQQ